MRTHSSPPPIRPSTPAPAPAPTPSSSSPASEPGAVADRRSSPAVAAAPGQNTMRDRLHRECRTHTFSLNTSHESLTLEAPLTTFQRALLEAALVSLKERDFDDNDDGTQLVDGIGFTHEEQQYHLWDTAIDPDKGKILSCWVVRTDDKQTMLHIEPDNGAPGSAATSLFGSPRASAAAEDTEMHSPDPDWMRDDEDTGARSASPVPGERAGATRVREQWHQASFQLALPRPLSPGSARSLADKRPASPAAAPAEKRVRLDPPARLTVEKEKDVRNHCIKELVKRMRNEGYPIERERTEIRHTKARDIRRWVDNDDFKGLTDEWLGIRARWLLAKGKGPDDEEALFIGTDGKKMDRDELMPLTSSGEMRIDAHRDARRAQVKKQSENIVDDREQAAQLANLGFSRPQITDLQKGTGARARLPAVICETSALLDFGYTHAQITKVAIKGSAPALPALRAHTPALLEIEFAEERSERLDMIAKMASWNGSAEALPTLVRRRRELAELGYTPQHMFAMMNKLGGAPTLRAVLEHTPTLLKIEFAKERAERLDMIAQMASRKGSADALPALVRHLRELAQFGYTPHDMFEMMNHDGALPTLQAVLAHTPTLLETGFEDTPPLLETELEEMRTRLETELEDIRTLLETGLGRTPTRLETELEDMRTRLETVLERTPTPLEIWFAQKLPERLGMIAQLARWSGSGEALATLAERPDEFAKLKYTRQHMFNMMNHNRAKPTSEDLRKHTPALVEQGFSHEQISKLIQYGTKETLPLIAGTPRPDGLQNGEIMTVLSVGHQALAWLYQHMAALRAQGVDRDAILQASSTKARRDRMQAQLPAAQNAQDAGQGG